RAPPPAGEAPPGRPLRRSSAPNLGGGVCGGGRRGGAYASGRWLAGSRALQPPPPQQIFEEGLGGLILARRGRRPDGKRRAGSLQALRLGGGIDHDGRNTEAVLGHGKLQLR